MANGNERGAANLKQRLTAFLFGGAVGLAAGILLAPRSGRELRDNLVSRAEDAAERGREVYYETQERVQERVSEVGERAPYRDDEDRPEDTPIVPEAEPAPEEQRPRPARSEELLRKIEETRARLREQMERERRDEAGEEER
jgi:gas vesicle protein